VCRVVLGRAQSRFGRAFFVGFELRRGLPAAAQHLGVMTAIDNERIQIDLVAQQWQSDFRGQATGQGRCETVPG